MNPAQFLSILKARWLGSLIVLLLAVVASGVATYVTPKRYTASAAVLVDIKTLDPIMGGMAAMANLATQIEVIKSDRVAQRVVRDLKLTDNAAARKNWMEDTQGSGSYEAWITETIKRPLDARAASQSNVITIAYVASDPRFAAALANAFVRGYVDTSLELRVDPSRRQNAFFDDRAKDLRESIEKSQAKLSAYQREHGILVTDERVDIENQRLNELSSQLVTIQALTAESRSRSSQASNASDQSQDVINNPMVSGLRGDLARQEVRMQELSSKFGDAHPQVVELRANIAELRKKLDIETRRVTGSVSIANNINASREADVRSALEAQRGKVLKMRSERDEVALLQREVETAQRAYDTVLARATQSSIESQSNQTNISLLSLANEPTTPSIPKPLPQMLLMGLGIGIALGIGFALLRERLDRRVRTADDINTLIGLPVIGSLPKPLGGVLATRGAALQLPNNVLGRLPSPGQ
ncbi:MAG: chain length determinant protein EpsF [Burkholderiales bacterium]